IAKLRLRPVEPAASPLPFLVNVLENSLRLLHPFMPFVTEELWQNVKQHFPEESHMTDSIMTASYPVADSGAIDPEAERAMNSVIEIIRSIRNVRARYKVEAAKQIEAWVYADELLPQISSQAEAIKTLARVNPLAIAPRRERKSDVGRAVVLVLKESEVILPWASLVDLSVEEQRLTREREVTEARIGQLDARLRDNDFLAKAPQHVVEKEKQRLTELSDKLERVKLEISQLRS
ncbi:MAG: class I tRNA ligase family protein, partial [Dehalococcoidales bacterium]|nr:class I tRNA ligase family protein [Dehalococcoidales bacterium]